MNQNAQTTKLANGAKDRPVGRGVDPAGFESQSAQRNTEGFPIRVHPSRPLGESGSVVGSAAPGAQNATFHGLTPFEVSATTNGGTIHTAGNIDLWEPLMESIAGG